MDAISKELETWTLTFMEVLATLINLMLRKYFFVLVETRNVNVMCKFKNLEQDMAATLINHKNVKCRISSCRN